MKKRQLIIVAGIVLFIGGILGKNYLASMKKSSERKPPHQSGRSVSFQEIKNKTVTGKIPVTGKIESKHKIDIYAEVTGNLLASSERFKEGNSYRKGQVLLGLDDSELRLSIQASKSNLLSLFTRVLPDLKLDYPAVYEDWKAYTDAFSLQSPLTPLPIAEGKEKYYLSTQGVFNQYYSIKSQEARLAKYRLVAPFDGTVSSSEINPGTLVRSGQKMGEFIRAGIFEMPVSIDAKHLPFAQIGAEVSLFAQSLSKEVTGKIIRINQALDATTQSAQLIISVENPDLKDGMFLNGYIQTQAFEDAVILRNDQINTKSIAYVIKDNKLRERKVQPLFRGENEIITSDFETGEKILRNIYPSARDGASVQIEGENQIQETEKQLR